MSINPAKKILSN